MGAGTDPAAVLAALGLPDPVNTVRMPGAEARVWRAELADGRTVAVRVLRAGRSAAGELAALRLAAEHDRLAPDVLASGSVGGCDAIVSSWCAGTTIGELLTSGGDVRALGRLMGRAQRRLHRPLPDGSVLCHLDFQPYNVLVVDGRVTGIVDWSNARRGDPREDLAWTRVVLAFAPALVPEFAAMVDDFVSAWAAGYGGLPSGLGPCLAAAARRQVADWTPRAAAGECPHEVLDAAVALTRRWTDGELR